MDCDLSRTAQRNCWGTREGGSNEESFSNIFENKTHKIAQTTLGGKKRKGSSETEETSDSPRRSSAVFSDDDGSSDSSKQSKRVFKRIRKEISESEKSDDGDSDNSTEDKKIDKNPFRTGLEEEDSSSGESLSDIFMEDSESKTDEIAQTILSGGKKRKDPPETEETNEITQDPSAIFSDDDGTSESPKQPKKVFKRIRKGTSQSDDEDSDISTEIEKPEKSPFAFKNQTKLLRRKASSEPDLGAVQELSLQKLSFPRIGRHIGASETEMKALTLEKMISKIIDVYNNKKEKRKKTNQNLLKPVSFKSFANPEGYKLRVYTHTKKQKSRLTRELEKGSSAKLSKSKGVYHFLFFFREKPEREIIVATSGQGWQVLRPCVQYDYPFNVVKRILNPERITEITRHCFVGSAISETIINPEGHKLYARDSLYKLVNTFKCEVKDDSSLMGLKSFSKEAPPIIKVATGLLRIQRNIPLRRYPQILNLFSQYVRGEKTYTRGEGKHEEFADPLFEFLHFLRPVFTEQRKLDVLLIEKIHKSYREGQSQTVFFRHKYLRDYLYASSYHIRLSARGKFEGLETRPSNLEEVLGLLDESSFENGETLLTAFEKGCFKFINGGRETQGSLMEYLEGEVRTLKGGTYFKISGMWFKLAADCHALLQQDFKQLLSKVLIDPEKDKGQLPRAWQGNAPKGKLTEKIIKEKLGITKGIKALMKVLKTEKVCYVDKGRVLEKHLAGEILFNPLIKAHQEEIEKFILSSERVPSQEELLEVFGEDLEKILEELKRKRSVFDSKGYVINPMVPYRLKNKAGLLKIIREYHEMARGNREKESIYNRSYLYDQRNGGVCYGPETGYLVLDEICPFNVEPCDIIYYNQHTTYMLCVGCNK